MAGRAETSTARTTIAGSLVSTPSTASTVAAVAVAGHDSASAAIDAAEESMAATKLPAPRRSRRIPDVELAVTATAWEPGPSERRHAAECSQLAAACEASRTGLPPNAHLDAPARGRALHPWLGCSDRRDRAVGVLPGAVQRAHHARAHALYRCCVARPRRCLSCRPRRGRYFCVGGGTAPLSCA